MKLFFKKELCANKFFVDNSPVPFECQPSNTGVIALDSEADAKLVAALDDAISKRKGGIGKIDEATYEAIKKNKIGRVSAAFLPSQRLQVLKVPSPFGKPKDTAVVAAAENPVHQRSPANSPGEALGSTDQRGSFIPRRGKVLNDSDKTKVPGNP
jgi:hypothetical protein